MMKLLFCLFSVVIAISGSSQSVSFECQYDSYTWGTLGTVYCCSVQNSVSIISIDVVQVKSISGTHKSGYSNDNVEVIQVEKGQIYYFPHNMGNVFKNIKGILIHSTGLKEIHKNDLKSFPKLRNLYLYESNLEVLEENLFEFNPDLELIYFESNKISHIDPNVFDKLTKLKTLNLKSNTCINMNANSPTQVQNIIKTAKNQCINSDYSNLIQKVKNLEIESKNLNSENLNEKLENLENEIKSSKFLNFFQDELQSLKAVQNKKEQEENVPKLVKETNEKISVINDGMLSLSNKCTASSNETLTENNNKLEKISNNIERIEDKVNLLEHKLTDLGSMHLEITKSNQKILELDEKVFKHSKDTATTLKDIESSNNQNFAAIMNFIENLSKKMEAIEDKLRGIDSTQKKLINKIHKIETESHDNKVDFNKQLKAIANSF